MSKQTSFIILMTAVSFGACAPPPEEVETSESAIVRQSTVDVGLTSRHLSIDTRCAYTRCAQYRQLSCVRLSEECTEQIWSAKLHADQPAANAGAPFPAHDEGANYSAKGCGPKAAQNVLGYFGVALPIAEVARWIETIDVPFSDEIATKPDELVKGLQGLLNAHGKGSFTVRRQNGNDQAVARELLRTRNPVIVLANAGSHFLTITGYDSTPVRNLGTPVYNDVEPDPDVVAGWFYATDYPWNGVPRVQDLKMHLGTGASWLSAISLGSGGYSEFTFITIDRGPPKCTPRCLGGLGFVPGQGAVCRGGWVEDCN